MSQIVQIVGALAILVAFVAAQVGVFDVRSWTVPVAQPDRRARARDRRVARAPVRLPAPRSRLDARVGLGAGHALPRTGRRDVVTSRGDWRAGASARVGARLEAVAATRGRGRPAGGAPSRRSRAGRRPRDASRRRPGSPTRSVEAQAPHASTPAGRRRRWRRSSRTSPRETTRVTQASTPRSAGVRPGPVRSGALDGPEGAEGRQHQTDRELDRVLGHPRQRRTHQHADDGDQRRALRRRRPRRAAMPALRAAERDHDERDLEPFEQHALEGDRERVPVETGALAGAACGLGALLREDRLLVVQGLVPARAQDRLAQPLQAEDEQERPTTSRSASIGRSAAPARARRR